MQEVDDFLKSIGDLKKNIKECRRCHNISDGEICEICSDPKRDNTTLCVVENIKDILSIEATSQYNGLYHVLGGIISPMDGIGPADLHITSLVERVEQEPIREIIFALCGTGNHNDRNKRKRDENTDLAYRKLPGKVGKCLCSDGKVKPCGFGKNHPRRRLAVFFPKTLPYRRHLPSGPCSSRAAKARIFTIKK